MKLSICFLAVLSLVLGVFCFQLKLDNFQLEVENSRLKHLNILDEKNISVLRDEVGALEHTVLTSVADSKTYEQGVRDGILKSDDFESAYVQGYHSAIQQNVDEAKYQLANYREKIESEEKPLEEKTTK